MRTFTLLVAFTFSAVMTTFAAGIHQDPGSTTHEKNRAVYRTIHKARYRIIDTAGFYLYSHDQLVQGMKIARPGTIYYFSVAVDSAPIPLTVANLEKAYAQNRAFCYLLSTDFNSDKDLLTWVPSLKTFKVKYAYVQSLK